jgi:hypothetical protein
VRGDGTRRPLALAIYGLVAANLAALWWARGPFVCGWDLFGATYGVLALEEEGLAGGVARIARAVLRQRERPVFTGGESLIYGLVPGLLGTAWPWLLWTHLLNLTLFVAISGWLIRRLPVDAPVYWAAFLASPALVSQSMVGLPDLASNAIPYGLAILWVLSPRQPARHPLAGAGLDVVVFALLAAVAFNGYESGKTFFVVPLLAALTVPRVPLLRRVSWLACAVAVAWLVASQRAMTTAAALAAVPREPAAFLRGLLKAARTYLVDWSIDFPALAVAALVSLPFLRAHRCFWSALVVAALGLVSLNAFQFDGAFLVPHRFLLLGVVSLLVVGRLLSERPRRGRPAAVVAGLLAAGGLYTTAVTVRFATEPRSNDRRDWQVQKTFALPYNHARLDAHLWRDRIADAAHVVERVRAGHEPHVFFYGFSVGGEDSVNPQLFVSRVLLALGWDAFTARTRFFDHGNHMYFPFPIRPLGEVRAALAALPPPFFVHVREPEHDAASIVAAHLNRARVTPVDLGLRSFTSLRVDEFAPPGPIPVPPLPRRLVPLVALDGARAPGFCLTTWRQDEGAHSPLQHWGAPLPLHLRHVLLEARTSVRSTRYVDVARRFVPAVAERTPTGVVDHFVGYVDHDGPAPLLASLRVRADDEVAVVLNGQTILESQRWKPAVTYREEVLLPPGRTELVVLYHRFWNAGGLEFASVDADGRPITWSCDPGFG